MIMDKRPQAVAGRRYRTPAGMIEVSEVEIVEVSDVTDADARASGYPDAATLVDDLRGDPGLPVRRIRFRIVDEPDPRAVLAADGALDGAARLDIERRLARLDQASAAGPWTRETLELIAEHPEVRAGDLADMVGRDRASFKLDVRKLKNLGLTESLPVGYRLSPRGRTYLDGVS